MSTCSSCGAEIIWVRVQASGKAMPIDEWSRPDGNIREVDRGDEILVEILGRKEAQRLRDEGVPLFRSHFATCPNAAKHRRRV